MSIRTLPAIGALLLLALPQLATAQTLYFTAIPDQDETQLRERFDAVADYLSEQLGVAVDYVPVKSYAASVTAFRNNQVQLAWFGGLSGVRAQQLVEGSRAIAQGVDDPRFHSYIIAHRSSGLQPSETLPEGLRGKTFTFGSRGSTSGRLMPEYFLTEHFNESPGALFRRVGFSGNHSRTVKLVESGAWESGAVNYKVWDSMVASGEVDTDAVQVVWKSPPYPDYHWVVRGDVDERFAAGFAERIQQALLDLTDETLLARFPRKGFIPASNEDYAPILETARQLGLME